jgi:hypothetical protein
MSEIMTIKPGLHFIFPNDSKFGVRNLFSGIVRGSILKDVSATKELFTRMSHNILPTIVISSYSYHHFNINLCKIIIIDSIFDCTHAAWDNSKCTTYKSQLAIFKSRVLSLE